MTRTRNHVTRVILIWRSGRTRRSRRSAGKPVHATLVETTNPVSHPRWWRRFAPRLSLRALMMLVLLFGGWLGWVVHHARVQRDAVRAVARAGGGVLYDWQIESGKVRVIKGSNKISNEVPWWPKWLVKRLGVEYFGSVHQVSFWSDAIARPSDEIDQALAQVGHLSRLEHLALVRSQVSDAGLVHLESLSSLKALTLR